MVNHTKLISPLTFSPLSNNTKRWVSAYLKGLTTSCRYNFTICPSYHVTVAVPQGACMSLLYSISLPLHSLNMTTFSVNLMQITSLLPVPTPTLLRWLKLLPPMHQILKSGRMSEVYPFLLQNPPSLLSPLNSHNLTPMFRSF